MLRADRLPTGQQLKNVLAQARKMHEQYGPDMRVRR
jgi:hypothetical protein